MKTLKVNVLSFGTICKNLFLIVEKKVYLKSRLNVLDLILMFIYEISRVLFIVNDKEIVAIADVIHCRHLTWRVKLLV